MGCFTISSTFIFINKIQGLFCVLVYLFSCSYSFLACSIVYFYGLLQFCIQSSQFVLCFLEYTVNEVAFASNCLSFQNFLKFFNSQLLVEIWGSLLNPMIEADLKVQRRHQRENLELQNCYSIQTKNEVKSPWFGLEGSNLSLTPGSQNTCCQVQYH